MRLAQARVNPLAPDALRPAAGARAAVAAADQSIQSIDPPAGPCALEREKGGLDKREKRGGWRLDALERVQRRQARAGFCRSPSPFPTRNRPRKIPSRRTIQTPQRLNFGRAVWPGGTRSWPYGRGCECSRPTAHIEARNRWLGPICHTTPTWQMSEGRQRGAAHDGRKQSDQRWPIDLTAPACVPHG